MESDEANEWLSAVFDKPVVLLRAFEDRQMTIDASRLPHTLKSDRRRAFLTDAALHFVNRKSLAALEKMVLDRQGSL